MKLVSAFLSLIKDHKAKWLLTIASAIAFFAVIFPLSDLSDFISAKVAQLTQNSVYITFDQMHLTPSPGLELTQFSLDTAFFPPLSAESISVSPSISALLKQSLGGSASAKGLFKGQVDVQVQSGTSTEAGVARQKFIITAQSVSLEEIRQFASLPIQIKGRMDLDAKAQVDLTFSDQPEVDIVLKAQKLDLPPNTVNTIMGPLPLPELKLGQLYLKGRLISGKFTIEEGRLGQEGDELTGTIKGYINLTMQNQKSKITPIVGAYNFDLDLSMKKNLVDRASMFLTFVDQFKSATTEGARFAFRLSATNPNMPPDMSALH